jgi:hypothetical protein
MFLLHLYYAHTDLHQTLAFESAFKRALWMIALTAQPVVLTVEDLS